MGCGDIAITQPLVVCNNHFYALVLIQAQFLFSLCHIDQTCADCQIQEGTADGSVRLRGGFGAQCDVIHSGTVEVLINGEWGTICYTPSDAQAGNFSPVADVACRQMGFPYGALIDSDSIGSQENGAGLQKLHVHVDL